MIADNPSSFHRGAAVVDYGKVSDERLTALPEPDSGQLQRRALQLDRVVDHAVVGDVDHAVVS